MTSLVEISQNMSSTVAEAAASVVRVDARRRFPATGFAWENGDLVITANHVVRRDDNIRIGLADGNETAAQVIGRDLATDIALLKLDVEMLPTLKTADEQALGVGNLVLALGRPGLSIQATLGILSARGPAWRTRHGGHIDAYVQTDVLMYPGFSGGPLISAAGALIGLNTSAIAHGVSVTLPVSTLVRVSHALLNNGRVKRGYLGVSTQIVKLQGGLQQQLGQKSGLLIIGVEPESPAEIGGLTIGDTIVQVGATKIRRHDDLMAELLQIDFEQKTPITIIRGGEVRTLQVTIGEQE